MLESFPPGMGHQRYKRSGHGVLLGYEESEAGDVSPYSRAGKRLKKIEEINDAAAVIFVRDGYAQFSARKVAKELGISLNNLQHYCGNTENLCRQMIKAKLGHFVEAVNHLVENACAATPIERLAVAIRENSSATFDTETGKFFFQMGALASHDESVKDLMVSQYNQFLTGFCQLITEINPALPADKVRTYAALIATQIEGNFFYQDQLSPTSGLREQMVETAISFWTATLTRSPADDSA
ncbi:TetR/AcrR family transcriptional regulator [Pseudomonas sp. RIT288]|uniref:TetR/AcrR family transcriptional regulator n=1 Tax=Pseudomonas sp. RIT288 TaxID=1470589 RepID=UPI000645542F|nr:TetR/AcrR family transcriptional regulator [Pseudomonas sp. RIT288]